MDGRQRRHQVSEKHVSDYARWVRANAGTALRRAKATDGYESSNLSVLSQRLFRNNPIVSFAYAQFPEGTIECVLSDGTIASLVSDSQDIKY